jgi:hypothetical protein
MNRLASAALLAALIGAAVGIAGAAPVAAKPGSGTPGSAAGPVIARPDGGVSPGDITLSEAEAMCAEMDGYLSVGREVECVLPDSAWELVCPVDPTAGDEPWCTIDHSEVSSR